MVSLKKVFNYLSYLQYPILFGSIFFVIKPYLTGFESLFEDFNNALIGMGLGISFSTLQDTTKTQNEVSRKIWSDPIKTKRWIYTMLSFCLVIMLTGTFVYFSSIESFIQEISIGLIVFSIGFLGMIKAAMEMADYQQKKNQ